ncbi:MAG: transcriptional repressor [Lachnospiraceae bacterium]|nr:transcriptional repressor [Lachnospiraceae bacterium]
MTIDKDKWEKILRDKGIKVTKQRVLVLGIIASSPDRHFTAEEIYDLVKAEYPEIGLATVYRTIQVLVELHLVDKLSMDDGFARYEFGKEGGNESGHHHHHLICTRCGSIFSFQDDLLEELEKKILSKTGFLVSDHEVKLYGCCKECGGKVIEKSKSS